MKQPKHRGRDLVLGGDHRMLWNWEMEKALRIYAEVLRLVRRLPEDTRPYYAKYARENFVNYREVEAGDDQALHELFHRAYKHSLWVLNKVNFLILFLITRTFLLDLDNWVCLFVFLIETHLGFLVIAVLCGWICGGQVEEDLLRLVRLPSVRQNAPKGS